MTKYYIARNYRSKYDAAGKAKMDCEVILERNGWKNLGFKQTWISNAILGTIVSAVGITWALLRLKKKSILCLQYPLNKFYRYILWGASLKRCHIVTIVHDVISLKRKVYFTEKEIGILSKSECLIVHNEHMRKWFEENKLDAKTVELDIFDYLHVPIVDIPKLPVDQKQYRIVFAGGMGGNKSFIYQLDTLKRGNFKYCLYGVGFNTNKIINPEDTILDYQGFFPSNEVIDHIDGDFGLVWYGDSLESCDGATGQYLKFNNPHKLSLYLQCEMPIIIWEKAGMANFVSKNKIGITIGSLSEIQEKLMNLSQDEFDMLKANVLKMKEKLSEGYFLQAALQKAI